MLAIVSVLVSCTSNSAPATPSITLPLNLKLAGSRVVFDLHVVEEAIYSFSLVFMFGEHNSIDRARAKRLAGGYDLDQWGRLVNPGLAIFLELEIRQIQPISQSTLVKMNSSELPLSSWGGDNFSKVIYDAHLNPGDYKVSVTSLVSFPEEEGAKVFFSIARAYRGK